MDPTITDHSARIRHMEDCQVRDPQRGFFAVGIKPCTSPRFHRGRRVYTDASGKRFTIGEPRHALVKPIKPSTRPVAA